MRASSASDKIPYLTFAQVVAAVSVVFLHTNGCFWSFSAERWWVTANIIESVFNFAVPLFFMITGVTLINYPERYDLSAYFKKRLKKTVLPFLVWSLIGLAYQWYRGVIAADQITLPFVVRGILHSEIITIYWFFPVLFSVYLSMPLFAAVPKEKRRGIFGFLLAAALVCNALLPLLIQVFHLDLSWPVTVGAASGYLMYVLAGVLLHENPPGAKARAVIYLLGLTGLAAQIIGTHRLSMAAGEIVRTYKGYVNLPVLLYSFAVFVLFSRIGPRVMASPVGGLVRLVGKYTFPIYLIHWYVMDTIVRTFHVPTTSIWYRLGAPFVIVPVVMLITWLLRKLPGVRAIVP